MNGNTSGSNTRANGCSKMMHARTVGGAPMSRSFPRVADFLSQAVTRCLPCAHETRTQDLD